MFTDLERRAVVAEDELSAYKKYVKDRLSELVPVFAKASIGEFNRDLKIPEKEDEFTEFLVGVQIMIEVIREKIIEFNRLNKGLEEEVKHRTQELEQSEGELKNSLLLLNSAVIKEKERSEELAKFNKLMIGRELKMIDLKAEIEKLKKRLG